MKEKKIIWQLYPSYLLVIIITLVLLLSFASSTFKTFYTSAITHDLKSMTLLIEPQVMSYLTHSSPKELTEYLGSQGHKINTRFTVISPTGIVIADSHENPLKMNNHSTRPEFIQALSGDWGTATRYSNTLRKKMQ